MHPRPITLAAVAMLLGPTPLPAQTPTRAAPRGPMALDVAGVRLGMAADATRAALATASYRCGALDRARSFDERVRAAVLERGGRSASDVPYSSPSQVRCDGPNGETLEVDFAQVRGGPIVHHVELAVDPARVDQTALRRQVATRFGPPTLTGGADAAWCDSARRCSVNMPGSETPYARVTTETMNGLRISAWRGTDARHADEVAVRAEAARLAPAKSSAAF